MGKLAQNHRNYLKLRLPALAVVLICLFALYSNQGTSTREHSVKSSTLGSQAVPQRDGSYEASALGASPKNRTETNRAPASFAHEPLVNPKVLQFDPKANRDPSSLTELEKTVASFEDRILTRIGRDDLSSTSAKIAHQLLRKKMGLPFDQTILDECSKPTNCPHELKHFYSASLARAGTADLPEYKALVMERMLQSEIPLEGKQEIMIQELSNPEIADLQPSQQRDEKGRTVLSADARYLLETQKRLFSVTTDLKKATDAALFTIANLRDPRAKLALSVSLLQHNSQNAAQIIELLPSAGLSPDEVEAVKKYQDSL